MTKPRSIPRLHWPQRLVLAVVFGSADLLMSVLDFRFPRGIVRCGACGSWFWPTEVFCPECGRRPWLVVSLVGFLGALVAWSLARLRARYRYSSGLVPGKEAALGDGPARSQ